MTWLIGIIIYVAAAVAVGKYLKWRNGGGNHDN